MNQYSKRRWIMRTIMALAVGAILTVGVVAGHDHVPSDM
jgi:hypothetical protein